MDNAFEIDPLVTRLRDGLDRIAFVLRSDLWATVGGLGLNPAQGQVLALLSSRPAGLRPKEIAAYLVISAPSIADTLSALGRKKLVQRNPDPGDARAAIICVTSKGAEIGQKLTQSTSMVTEALTALPLDVQDALLLAEIALIRQLQVAGAIPLQRMCVTCRHFRPHAYPHKAKPHHCAFVNVAMSERDHRLECGEHEAADPMDQAATWTSFINGTSITQAQSLG